MQRYMKNAKAIHNKNAHKAFCLKIMRDMLTFMMKSSL